MMTRKNNFLVRCGIFVIVSFFSVSSVFAASDNKKWTVAAEKFKYSKGQTSTSVTDATAEMIPSRILENLGKALIRSVEPDERLERTRYDLRKERISLFLQLSSEYKKRDALVLYNYTERELKSKIAEQNIKIQDVKQKIEDNLQKVKDAEAEAQRLVGLKQQEIERKEKVDKSELWKYSTLVRNLFFNNEDVITYEDICFYKDDIMSLYKAGDSASTSGYLSYPFEKECVSAGINTLITGNITSYGDYLSVAVDIYLYPGATLIGSVMEVGSLPEMDYLCSSIARQIIPILANSMPVQIQLKINPDDVKSDVFMYVDDQLQTNISSAITLNSGVHTIQVAAEGYKTVATSYFFEGNTNYLIEVNLEERKNGSLYVGLDQSGFDKFLQSLPFQKEYSQYGTIYANGEEAVLDEENKSQIFINGNKILGQFISEDGFTAFYYVPEKLILDGSKVSINPKAMDRSEYIDTRRKWMYGSYSLLITSLIPTFFCYGQCSNYVNRYNSLYPSGLVTREDYEQAVQWQNWTKITRDISIGCGVFFVFELIRYFVAANSVLPQKAKATDYINPMPVKILPENAQIPPEEPVQDIVSKDTQEVEK